MQTQNILAIETSCDDTSLAVIRSDGSFFEIIEMVNFTQVLHNKFGGVMPELASREHTVKILDVFEELVDKTLLRLENTKNKIYNTSAKKFKIQDFMANIDYICYTSEPGLPGSLVVGKTFAMTLGKIYDKFILPTNHINGHIFSLLIDRKIEDLQFPMVVLTASGGHNDLCLVLKNEKISIEKIGYSLDDAGGECFDKVARMLGGPYPGGARIGDKAKLGKPNPKFKFKRIFLDHDGFNFSFSGMKSQANKMIEELKLENIKKRSDTVQDPKDIQLDDSDTQDIAYEFQEAVVEVMTKKLVRAGIKFEAKTLGIAGGVSCNDRLWEGLNKLVLEKGRIHNQYRDIFGKTEIENGDNPTTEENKKVKIQDFQILRPVKKTYSTDNAGMIGVAGYINRSGIMD